MRLNNFKFMKFFKKIINKILGIKVLDVVIKIPLSKSSENREQLETYTKNTMSRIIAQELLKEGSVIITYFEDFDTSQKVFKCRFKILK